MKNVLAHIKAGSLKPTPNCNRVLYGANCQKNLKEVHVLKLMNDLDSHCLCPA